MRRTSIAALVLIMLALSAHHLKAQNHGTGLGVILGEPTGISFKHWLGGATAIDAGLAWSFVADDVHFHMTYLIHAFDWIKSDDDFGSRLNFYYGIGGRARFERDSRAGGRGVLGLVYFFKGAPLDAFVGIAPIMDVVPETELDLTGGIGMRYFF
jgi:hypothetical protein